MIVLSGHRRPVKQARAIVLHAVRSRRCLSGSHGQNKQKELHGGGTTPCVVSPLDEIALSGRSTSLELSRAASGDVVVFCEVGADVVAGVEDGFVDGVAVGAQSCCEGVDGYFVDGHGDEDASLVFGEYVFDGVGEGVSEFDGLHLLGWFVTDGGACAVHFALVG